MSNIFFTSDTHFGHANIAGKNVSKWEDGYRDFSSVEAMNQELVKQINKIVKPNDVLYHLGDWSFGGIDNIWKFRKQINCQNIHLILGNHDHHIEENKILPNVERVSKEDWSFIDKLPARTDSNFVNAQELFSSVSHYKEIKIANKMVVLSHYSHRIWHGSHKEWFHLYGHSHDSLPPYGKSHDVGVDSAKRLTGDYRPFYAGEIMGYIENLPSEFPDHHNPGTNTGKPQKNGTKI